MYPTGRFEHFETICFQFSGSKEPSLKINATSEDNNLAIHFESGDQASYNNNMASKILMHVYNGPLVTAVLFG